MKKLTMKNCNEMMVKVRARTWARIWEKTTAEENQSGFSLIEMMIVLAIIALIMSFVGTNVMRRYDESKLSATKIQIRQLGVILDDFRRVCGRYPNTDEGLDALIKAPASLPCKNYDPEGFIKDKKVPKDPWDKEFEFTSDGNKYVLKSLGAKERMNKDIDSDHLD